MNAPQGNNHVDILDILQNTSSLYMYHDSCEKTPSAKSKPLSKNDVIAEYDSGKFTNSDLQIVKLVAKNVFCTQGMIEKEIKHYNKVNHGSGVMLMDTVEVNLKSRLTDLVKCDILKKYTYTTPDLKTGNMFNYSYYLTSPHGYNFIKRILKYNDNYDEYLAIKPLEEVLKYLSVVATVQSLYDLEGYISNVIDKPLFLKDKRIMTNLYGYVDFERKKKQCRLVLEPVKFKHNKEIISDADWLKDIEFRYSVLKAYMQSLMGKYEYAVLLLCDDIEGIKRAGELALKIIPEYINYIYFSTDAVVVRYGVDAALLQLKENGDMVVDIPEFLKIDKKNR